MTKASKIALGIDIGGTGIKAAPVNLETGEFTEDRYRIPTPQPATPAAIVATLKRIIARFDPKKKTPIGVTFPGVVQHGVIKTAANVDDEWLGVNLEELIFEATGLQATVLNDADAAGYGEYRYGAAHGGKGAIFLATLGTGIGTALIVDGKLVPNTELGHLHINGEDFEPYAAESARQRFGLDWDQWTANLQIYFSEIERLLWPDLIIVGGGVSKSSHMFLPNLNLRAPIIPAELLNGAGIVGAAAAAAKVRKDLKKAAKKSK